VDGVERQQSESFRQRELCSADDARGRGEVRVSGGGDMRGMDGWVGRRLWKVCLLGRQRIGRYGVLMAFRVDHFGSNLSE
jgi:hypothetical protein